MTATPNFDTIVEALRGWKATGPEPPWGVLQMLARRAAEGDRLEEQDVLRMWPRGTGDDVESLARLLHDQQVELGIVAGRPVARRAESAPAETPAPASRPTSQQPAPRPPAAAAPGEGVGVLASYTDPDALAAWRDLFVSTDPTLLTGGDPAGVRTDLRGDAVVLSWPALATDHAVTLYRVVASGREIFLPEQGTLLALTQGVRFIDDRARQESVTRYRVWAHTGASAEDATLSQPVLVAQAWFVAPPRDVVITEVDGGEVVGRWPAVDARPVQVFRVPTDEVGVHLDDPYFRICTDSQNTDGFRDRDAEPGKDYVYVLKAEANVGGALQHSPAIQKQLTTRPRIDRPEDFQVHEHVDEAGRLVLDLIWTPTETGTVEVYRSNEQPTQGIDVRARSLSVLSQLKLGELIPYPPTSDGRGRMVIRDVPWPEDWPRIHLTPVTVLADWVFPGATTTRVARHFPIDEIVIHERSDHQVVTLAWPTRKLQEGQEHSDDDYVGSVIRLYVVPTGHDVDTALKGDSRADITLDKYLRLGGLTVQLPPEGCDVALVPIIKDNGQDVPGSPSVAHYDGLRSLEYQVSGARIPLLKKRKVAVRVRSRSGALTDVPNLVLVHAPDRLPLGREDGTPIPLALKDDPAAAVNGRLRVQTLGETWADEAWEAEVPAHGFVRLLADVDVDELHRVAVHDPAVNTLAMG